MDTSTGTSSNTAKRRKTSNMWKYFRVEKDENEEERAYCLKFSKSYAYTSTSGTSNLKRHKEKCLGILEAERRVVNFDERVAKEKYRRVIIRHNLPFISVEYEELRDYFSYLNPDYKICLTSDCWTSLAGDGYIAVTAHYVDAKWVLHSKIVSFCEVLPPHSGEVLASKVQKCLRKWGIEKKVFTLTLDNVAANDNMQDVLRDRLNQDDNLVCKGEFFHVRCSAHILNLIVQAGLEVINPAFCKLRETAKYFKGEGLHLQTVEFDLSNAEEGSEVSTWFKEIQCLLEVQKSNEDIVIQTMISNMREKFDKYWEYFTRPYSHASEQGTETENFGVLDLDDIPETAEPGKSALDIYLEDPKLDMRAHPDLYVLRYWKENKHRFGALAFMDMDILSIPITTVASESSFILELT
uniref:HAT C-terminal dimerisation domain-containing protein n=1 Tax=Brassica oleracea var. oleracea TaxID=109376 RepID=A0A0D3BTU7_BRAOL